MKKKLLIVGNSAKEYSLAKILSEKFDVFVAPGNDFIKEFATVVDIRENSITELIDFVMENDISFTIASSEIAIKADIARIFESNNLMIFAPTADAAMFATNKSIGKKMMYKLKIPIPKFGVFEKKQQAFEYIKNSRMPIVIKTDEHKPSNNVMVCPSEPIAKSFVDDCLFANENRIVIEDFILGTNFSFYVITDGYKALPIGSVTDYKFSLEGNGGLITEGMGVESPCIKLTLDQEAYIMGEIVYPIIRNLADQQKPYLGIIGFDGVLTNDGKISIIECNPFLRDHDAQCILSLINDDIYKVMAECVIGSFADNYNFVDSKDEFAVSAVLSSGKYKDTVITGLDEVEEDTVITPLKIKKNTYLEYETQGGRALIVTTFGKTLSRSKKKLAEEIDYIKFDGKQYRKDICSIVD